jgi:DNA-binding CsgD family transcriptional regulator
LRAAIEWSSQGGQPERGARLCGALPAYWYISGAFTEGARRSAGLATADMPEAAKSAVLVASATMQMYCGDIEESIATATQALALARAANDRRMEARALLQIAMPQLMVDPIGTRAQFEEAIAMAREMQDWWVLNDMVGTLGMVLALIGDFAAAEPYLDEAMSEAQRAGDVDHVGSYWTGWAMRAHMLGQFADAGGFAAEGARLSAQTGNAMWTALGFVYRAAAQVALGRYTDAHRSLAEAAAVGSEDGLTSPLAKVCIGAAVLGEGDTAGALSAVTSALGEWPGILVWLSELHSLNAEACLSLGDVAGARAALDDALSVARTIQSGYHEGRALALVGRVERFEGNIERAESLLHEALRLHAENSDRPRLAETLESLGGIAASLESFAEAARLFGAAQALRDEMGYVRFAVHQERYDTDVATAGDGLGAEDFDAAWAEGAAMSIDDVVAYAQRGRGERKRPSTGWPSLTPTELEVVKLVAEGLTNPQIAERMFVALGTVRTHVGHIFAKLGVATRAELASLATMRSERRS